MVTDALWEVCILANREQDIAKGWIPVNVDAMHITAARFVVHFCRRDLREHGCAPRAFWIRPYPANGTVH